MSGNLFGLYRASVRNNDDPTGAHRLQVLVPAVGDQVLPWAVACVSGTDFHLPRVGDTVWIMFEAGDIQRPVWIGVLPGPAA